MHICFPVTKGKMIEWLNWKLVRDCVKQYHFIMITQRTLPTENEIVNEVLYDRRQKKNN